MERLEKTIELFACAVAHKRHDCPFQYMLRRKAYHGRRVRIGNVALTLLTLLTT
jgi:hypothetical protein